MGEPKQSETVSRKGSGPWTFAYVISSIAGAVLAPLVAVYALLVESTFCTDTGGCTEPPDTLAGHLGVAATVGVFALLCVGLPIYLGARVFPHHRWRVWAVALTTGFWFPALIGVWSLVASERLI